MNTQAIPEIVRRLGAMKVDKVWDKPYINAAIEMIVSQRSRIKELENEKPLFDGLTAERRIVSLKERIEELEQFYRVVRLRNEKYADEVQELEKALEAKDKALDMIFEWGGIDGGHHKQWLLNELVKVLADDHGEWIKKFNDGEDGADTYEWDEGIAP